MEVQVERQGEGEVSLRVSLGPEAVAAEVERVFKEAARSVEVPGFRPGRAPRAMIEARLNLEAVRQEALERLTHSGYLEALEKTGLEPVDRARIEEENLGEDGGFTFKATVSVMPEVKLGEYRGLKAAKPAAQVSEEAVEEELGRLRQRFAGYQTQTERAIEKGDVAIIDYAVEVEGRIVEGAGVNGYPLEVGTDSLFPQLNEGLLGAKPGEVRRIEGRLPQTFPNADLAGKEAVFVVTLGEVKSRTLPELDDEFAHKFAGAENMEGLRRQMRESLERVATRLAEQTVRERLLSQVVEASEVELPRLLVERFRTAREAELLGELKRQGASPEEYLASRGMSQEAWRRSVETDARQTLRRFLVVREIEKREGIRASEEEVEAEIVRLAEREQVSAAGKRRELEANDEIEDIASRLRREKVLQLLVDSAEISLEESAGAPSVQIESPEHGKE